MEDEINVLDYWRILLKWKKTVITMVLLTTVSSAVLSLLLPKTYKAEATLMPLAGQGGGGGLAMAAAARMGLAGIVGNIGSSSSLTAQLMAILKSRTLAERVVEKHGLAKVFFPKEATGEELGTDKRRIMERAVNAFFGRVTFTEDKKTQLIMIKAEMRDPELAANLINWYIEELVKYINENTFTSAKRNRIFIEEQLERTKTELLEAGKELATFYTTNQISNVVPTVDVDVSMRENVEKGLRIVDNTGTFTGMQQKTDALIKQADQVVEKIKEAKIVQGVPQQVYLQYLTLRSELLSQVNALLTQQYQMAKIEETKEDLNFQVIDYARVPTTRFKPKRRQIVMVAFMGSFFLAGFYVFARERFSSRT